jgi:nucleoside-diphosphate-sugar epimerase
VGPGFFEDAVMHCATRFFPPRSALDAATAYVTINLGSFLNVISQVIKHQSNIHFALEFGGECDNHTSEPFVSTSMYLHERVFQAYFFKKWCKK